MPTPIPAVPAVRRLTPEQELRIRVTGEPAAMLAALQDADAAGGKLPALFVAGALRAEALARDDDGLTAEGRAFQHARAIERIAQAQQARRR